MTYETEPESIDPRVVDQGEPVAPQVPTIDASPWRNRRDFDEQVAAATLGGLEVSAEGDLFYWDWMNIFGDKVSLRLENIPNDELLGPHAVLHMTQGEDNLGIELNTRGLEGLRDLRSGGVELNERQVLDVGDPEQISDFISVCARALESGIPPVGIFESAIEAKPRLRDPMLDRFGYHEQRRRDFSRQLSERHFL